MWSRKFTTCSWNQFFFFILDLICFFNPFTPNLFWRLCIILRCVIIDKLCLCFNVLETKRAKAILIFYLLLHFWNFRYIVSHHHTPWWKQHGTLCNPQCDSLKHLQSKIKRMYFRFRFLSRGADPDSEPIRGKSTENIGWSEKAWHRRTPTYRPFRLKANLN